MLAFVSMTTFYLQELQQSMAELEANQDDSADEHTIRINLLGMPKVCVGSKKFDMRAYASDNAWKIISYLALKGKTIPGSTLIENIWPKIKDTSDTNPLCSALYQMRSKFRFLCLNIISSNELGYWFKNDKKVHEEFVRTFFDEMDISSDDIGGVMAPVGTGVMAHTMLWEFSTVGAGYVNCPEPSPINMIEIIEKIPVTVIATRPNIASSIAYNPELCSIAQGSSVKKLAVGGGFLSDARRKMIEVAWGAECFNCFGMSEMFGPMAAECREKNGLHYLDKYLMIELLDPISKMPVPEGQPGIAVYTSLWEKGFPLLRYWTDDLMIVDRSKCKCG